MKSYLEGLAKGIFSYDMPQIIIDEEKVSLYMYKDDVFKGYFTLRALDGRMAEGFVYSSSHRMACLSPQFSGNEVQIVYEYSSSGLETGSIHNGKFTIVSNGGEIDLPYEVNIIEKEYVNELGIHGLNQFFKLASSNWYEAYKLFNSEEFILILERESVDVYDTYKALCANGITMQSMEEFLVSVCGKEIIDFNVVENGLSFDNVKETFKTSINIKKDSWGYIDLIIESDCDFARLTKNAITTEDFIGSTCNVEFFIDYNKLHSGINYGRIVIYSRYDSKEVFLKVIKGDSLKSPSITRMEERGSLIGLSNLYVDFRLNRLGVNSWANESVLLLSKLIALNPDNQWYKLIKAMALITSRQKQEAGWILDKFQSENTMENDTILWSFYLYVRSFNEEDVIVEAATKSELLELCKRNNNSWIIKWIRFHVDSELIGDMVDKYREIKECMNQGNTSPILYVEAACLINSNPLLVSNADANDVTILNWMCKKDCLNKDAAEHYMLQLSKYKRFKKDIYRLACFICDKYDTEANISNMCSFLIRMDKLDNEFCRWYRKGIEYDLKITRLYEYFIISVDTDNMEPLPKIIYMYFRYNSNIDNHKKAYLYANLINNKELFPEIYKSFSKTIEQFMLDQLYKGVINDNMALIYNEFFYSQLIMENLSQQIIDIMSTVRIDVEDGMINKVTVIYGKLGLKCHYAVNSGSAYIQIYSEDYKLVFSDGTNYYMSNINYKLTSLTKLFDYFRKALRVYNKDEKLVIKYLEHRDLCQIPMEEYLNLSFAMIDNKDVRDVYKQKIKEDIVNYYYENDDVYFENKLLDISADGFSFDYKIKYAEVLLRHRFYDQALKILRKYGYENISTDSLVKLVNYIIDKDCEETDDFFISLTFDVFQRGKYNETMLEYLSKNYFGSTNNMNSIRKACETFGLDTHILCENIIKQVIYTGTYIVELDKIYECYSQNGATDVMMFAYLNYFAYQFLIKQRIVSDSIFDIIYKELAKGNNLNDVCKLAFLKYISEKDSISNVYKDLARELMNYFNYKGIHLRCFKKLQQELGLKLGIGSKTTIEFITNPEHKVEIHYIFGNSDYIDEEMINVYEGIFVKEVTMFFGENIQYYITESHDDNETVVESGNLKRTEVAIDNNENFYDMLNDILISASLNDDLTTLELMKQYDNTKYVTGKLFTVR